jgi:hypothetical protein
MRPPASRMAWATRAAQRCSQTIRAAELEHVVQAVVLERGDQPVGVLLDEDDVEDVDDAVVLQLRDGGTISPLNRLPGNAITTYSTGPMSPMAPPPTARLSRAPRHHTIGVIQ